MNDFICSLLLGKSLFKSTLPQTLTVATIYIHLKENEFIKCN